MLRLNRLEMSGLQSPIGEFGCSPDPVMPVKYEGPFLKLHFLFLVGQGYTTSVTTEKVAVTKMLQLTGSHGTVFHGHGFTSASRLHGVFHGMM